MICPPCRAAGESNRLGIVKYPEGSQLREVMVAQAVGLHRQCSGRCDCQHKTGNWIQEGKRTLLVL